MTVALIGFAAVLLLAFMRMPLGVALGLVGLVGFSELSNYRTGMSNAARLVIDTGQSYGLSVVPLFILMGLMVDRGGMAKELYRAAYAFLGHRRGGLAMSTIVACGMFSAICGSSLATASIAAGGTLGILIPPSVILVIYGLITNASVGKLFIAGILPGLIGVLFYLAAAMFVVSRDPEAGPAGEKSSWGERLMALRDVWTTLGLFIFVIAYFRGALTPKIVLEVCWKTTLTTAKLFLVVFGAMVFSNFVNRAGLPDALLSIANGFDFPPLGVIFMILLIYLVLGRVFESFSMILLIVPIFAPLVAGLGFDLIWFGILVVVATEISLITPPIGMNVFVLKGVLSDVSVRTIFKDVTPFWVADIFRIVLIALVPAIALLLPSMML